LVKRTLKRRSKHNRALCTAPASVAAWYLRTDAPGFTFIEGDDYFEPNDDSPSGEMARGNSPTNFANDNGLARTDAPFPRWRAGRGAC
jgi:hypothetical protein